MKLLTAIRVACARAGMEQKDWVPKILEEATNGNDQRGAEGGVGSDHGEAGTDGLIRTADVRVADAEAGGLHATRTGERKKGLRGVRRDIREHVESEGGSYGGSSGKVLRPSDGAQSESGTVGGSAQSDTARQRAEQRARVMAQWSK